MAVLFPVLTKEKKISERIVAQEGLRTATEALAEMGEAASLPTDWLDRMARYRAALQHLLQVEGLIEVLPEGTVVAGKSA